MTPLTSSVVARMPVAPLDGDVLETTGRVVSALALGVTAMVTLAGRLSSVPLLATYSKSSPPAKFGAGV